MTTTGSLVRLRADNTRAVTALLAAAGSLSRADLARRTGLSRATISSLVADLIERGLVVEAPGRGRPLNGRSGRPPVLVHLSAPAGVVAGVDLGHAHVRVAVADRTGSVLAEHKVDLDVDSRGVETLDLAAAMLADGLHEAGVPPADLRQVVMCVPGPLDARSARVGSQIMPGWTDLPPAEELARRVGVPVHAENDANLGALAEIAHGAARGVSDLVHVKVASGLGAGLVLGGRLHLGTRGLAGELGHVTLPGGGQQCRCGRRGCLETVVTVPRVLAALSAATGPGLDAAGLLRLDREDRAEVGDSVREVLEQVGRVLGRPLAQLVTVLDLQCVVVGGVLAGSESFLAGVREGVRAHDRADATPVVDVRAGLLGERAEVLGAVTAALARAVDAAASR